MISTVSAAMKTISIVVPALNEEGVVGSTVRSIPIPELKKLGLETEIMPAKMAYPLDTNPRKSIFLQKHHHRAEHWMVRRIK